MDVVFDKWNVSRFVPRLYGRIYKYFQTLPLLVKLWVSSRGTLIQRVPNRWLWQRLPNHGSLSFNLEGSQFSVLALWNLGSESVGGWNLETLVEDSDLGGVSLIIAYFWYANFVWKCNKGEAENIILLSFVLWDCFNCSWVRSGGVG